MSFRDLAPQSEEVKTLASDIRLEVEKLGINPTIISPLTAVVNWQHLLTAESEQDREALLSYAELIGSYPETTRSSTFTEA
jgi:hypothetical protein